MDTMVMAVRVAMLIIATFAFTAMWSGDHPEQMAAVDRPGKTLIGHQIPGSEKRRPQVGERTEGIGFLQEPSFRNSAGTVINIPLPDRISPGRYLISDQFGRTQVRDVSEGEVGVIPSTQKTASREYYSVVVHPSRWHYIRIDVSTDDNMAKSLELRSSVH